ncbi:uncharacterized protein [Nicotiana tomentosiformis]|uniref:uncharacterized protein n=1 Tax=Nicotiana tomentosiformis TaxID=4098 RepID=UPI00388CC390
MNVLEEYEVASSEKINKEKSSFYINAGAQVDEVNTVHLIIEFRRHSFPFTYLSYPIFYSRRRKDFYKNIIFKVHDMLSSWKDFTRAIQAMEGQDIGLHGTTYVFLKVKEINEVLVPWIQGYHIWRKILQMRDDVEYQVWWQLKNAARYVWNYYGAPAGIRLDGKQLVQVINEWWSKPINTSLKTVYQVMPSLIVWHMWKKRNSGKHGKIMSINRLIIQITTSIQMLLKVRIFKGVTSNWLDLHEKLSQHMPKLRYTKVLWELHPVGWIKYITDGASYGFCIRDGIGDIIYAHADAVEDATNNVAEAEAILEALRYITQMQFPPCIIETNYLLMKRVLDEVWEPPWSIANQMDEIKTLMSKGAFQIFHVLREGNKLADHLPYLTLDQQHIVLALWKELGSMFWPNLLGWY